MSTRKQRKLLLERDEEEEVSNAQSVRETTVRDAQEEVHLGGAGREEDEAVEGGATEGNGVEG